MTRILALHGRGRCFGKCRIVRDQDRLRSLVVLGLRQQIRSNPAWVCSFVGNNNYFRRPGDHINARDAENLALRLGHIGISGAYDFGDGLDAFRAVGKRSNGLGAADTIDFGNAREVRGGQHGGIDLPARRWHDHHKPGTPEPLPESRSSRPSSDSLPFPPAHRDQRN